MTAWDVLFTNVHLATMDGGYGEIRDAAIAVKDGRIAWLGPVAALPPDALAAATHDGEGCWLTPGLIDCHTHIVHAGNRSDEFEARLNGATYEDIARAGGGSTTEIAVAPPGAGFDDFDWRVSLATITQDGPFSAFPGIDRTLALVDGDGCLLYTSPSPRDQRGSRMPSSA